MNTFHYPSSLSTSLTSNSASVPIIHHYCNISQSELFVIDTSHCNMGYSSITKDSMDSASPIKYPTVLRRFSEINLVVCAMRYKMEEKEEDVTLQAEACFHNTGSIFI